ncbi:MAG: LysM peptidoglycan-binding domain-containing protein [Chromatiales bacterium]|jgi:membrane-bound lytic murein transglycosylase D|nr:LysM peptidoglycan-binding domain-containing protein [Chromatiales bacterium]
MAPQSGPETVDITATAYEEDGFTPPWTQRTELFLPDPEHNTLEAEVSPASRFFQLPHIHHGDAQPNQHRDLWDRIRAGYSFEAQIDDPRIDAELAWYVNHADYLNRTVERARPYLHLIVAELEKRNIPRELALLPIVESAYQPFAYSRSHAAGLWQFIPETGRRYGLRQDWWYDGRRDVIASTRAALDYLEYLHTFFDGDWMLALAAYNSGEGNVKRAVTRALDADKPADFWSLQLPRETRAYVPKLLALREIFRQPEDYGIVLPELPNEAVIGRADTGGQIDLARAAELAGIGIDDLYQLNPAFNRWATAPDGPHELLLPLTALDRFNTALAALGDDNRVTWTRHLIRAGETLESIARKHHITVAVLREVNGTQGHVIRVGESLIVPSARQGSDFLAYINQRTDLARDPSASSRKPQQQHVVRPGDTLWSISRQYRVSVQQLAQWNAINSDAPLQPGQQLVLAQAGGNKTANGSTQRINYVVRKGDSLSRISEQFNVKVAELRRWNSLALNDHLQPGQRLIIHVDVTKQIANL